MRRPSSFCGNVDSIPFLARRRDVPSEDAECAGGFAHFGEGLVEARGVFRLYVKEELVFPRAAVNRAALDFEQVHSVLRKRPERSKQGAGTMREAHGKRSFAGFLGWPCRGLSLRY